LHGGALQTLPADGIINTLPINEALKMMEPGMQPEVLHSAEALKFRALVFVGLLVDRPKVLPSSFMYFREHSFNRISDLAQFGFHVEPDGCTQLVAEITCNQEDRAWIDDDFAKNLVITDLVSEHLLEPGEIIEAHVYRAQHAYPIYTLGYEKHLETLLKTVEGFPNLETAGRQGRFQYINSHIAMKMGYEAADRLVS